MRSIPLRLWALALFSALLQLLPFSIAGPVPLWRRVFCWVCLTPLLYALLSRRRDGKLLRTYQTALLAYLSGVIWYMGNCYWIYRTMHVYENIPGIASFGILLLFSLYVGLYHALFGALVGTLNAKYSRTAVLLASPFLWVAVELARARITGFPWDLLGYTQVDSLALTSIAPWTGVMGLSFVIAAINALWLIRPATRNPRKQYLPIGIAALCVLLATIAATHNRSNVPEPTQAVATLVQENLGVGTEAANESKQHMIDSFSQLSLHPAIGLTPKDRRLFGSPINDNSQIIVWPEAPTDFVDSDPVLRQAISSLALQAKAPVIINDVTFASTSEGGRANLYNSASFYLPDGSYAGHYDKMHLVPFGEYTPYKPLFFFVGHLLDDLVFIPGTQRTLFKVGDKTYGVFICYESIFGDDMRLFARNGAQVLINISDDGWYGDTSAPWEHLDMVRMRAIENRRWIVRSTNTGITAAIDPSGRVTEMIPRHIRTSVQVAFGYRNDITFYSQHGDVFAWFCALITIALLALSLRRKTFPARTQVN
jgi:apolipoprotein N-acyltransferase